MKVRQIIPADGWFSIFVDLEEEAYEIFPLAMWALCEPDARLEQYAKEDVAEQVIGLDADQSSTVEDLVPSIRKPGETYGFFEYVHQSTLDDPKKSHALFSRVESYIQRKIAALDAEA
jgi:hypothetical protein